MFIIILLLGIIIGAIIGLAQAGWWSLWIYLGGLALHLVCPTLFIMVGFVTIFHLLAVIFIPLGVLGGIVLATLVATFSP